MIISAIVSVMLKKSTSSSSATVFKIFTTRPKTPPEKIAHNSITRSRPSIVVVICLIFSSESSRLLTKFENASIAFMRISSAEGNSLNTSFQVSLTAEPILLIFSHNVPNALMILSRPPSSVILEIRSSIVPLSPSAASAVLLNPAVEASNAFNVSGPTIPSTVKPFASWNALTAACVTDPKTPSMPSLFSPKLPSSYPSCFRAFCICLTSFPLAPLLRSLSIVNSSSVAPVLTLSKASARMSADSAPDSNTLPREPYVSINSSQFLFFLISCFCAFSLLRIASSKSSILIPASLILSVSFFH